MNKIEADLFRYCCKQADYTKSKLYVFEYNFDINLSNKVGWSAEIYFQKPIDQVVRDFANKNDLKFDYVLKYANLWLHKGFIQKDYNYEESKDKYKLVIGKHFGKIDKYYNILPLRVFNHLDIDNPNNLPYDKPSYKLYSPKISYKEKKWFRALLNHCNMDLSYYDEEGFHFVISDFDKLFNKYSHSAGYSKNLCKKYLQKWSHLRMYFNYDGKYTMELSLNNPKHKKYIQSIPYRIYTTLEQKFINSFTD